MSVTAARLACLALTLAVSPACSRSEAPPSATTPAKTPDTPWALAVTSAALPAGDDSSEPQLTVSAHGVLASWVELRGTGAVLRYAGRTGGAWTPARTAASGSDWFLSWADVPSVLRLRDGTLVAQWLENVDPLIEAYDVKLATSTDNGRSWSKAVSPHQDGTRTQHGFVSLFEWPDAGAGAGPRGLGLVWLDGRDQELNTTDPAGGSMALLSATLSPALARGAERPVNLRVCECCPTSVAVSADGVIAAFRDRSATDVRDIHVSRFEGGAWGSPVSVHDDHWQIDACPVNGPSISALGRRVAVAWFTAPSEQGHVYVAFSNDAGRTWGDPVRVDTDTSLGHVDVELLDDGSAAVSWIEFSGDRSRFAVRRVDPAGTRSMAVMVDAGGEARVSGYPRMARMGDELVFAWTESTGTADATQHVKGAVARIPGTTTP
jgi:hypothetical protein